MSDRQHQNQERNTGEIQIVLEESQDEETIQLNPQNLMPAQNLKDLQSKAAQSILPTGAEIYKVVKYLDLSVNIEIILFEFHSILFWSSLIEILIFVVGLLLFFSYPQQMAFIFIHILHPVRGIIGFLINKRLPKSHDIVAEIGKLGDEPMTFQEFRERSTNQMRGVFMRIVSDLEKLLQTYFAITVICAALDFIEFIIQLIRFGRIGDEYSDLVMIAATVLFLIIDFFYAVWIFQVKNKFPAYISEYISKALYGFTAKMKTKMQESQIVKRVSSLRGITINDLNESNKRQFEKQQMQNQQMQ